MIRKRKRLVLLLSDDKKTLTLKQQPTHHHIPDNAILASTDLTQKLCNNAENRLKTALKPWHIADHTYHHEYKTIETAFFMGEAEETGFLWV